ncbi:Hypothetical_protein [Hexamita inflata]|uniref:Hypothetical_protein n=1 Tax=Hexamita inflata TaxID=28002 RepID=A0AA86P698_9EUKA|nr:Hypothetical protein HINF_LOCUS18667 [Hexamita inflata]
MSSIYKMNQPMKFHSNVALETILNSSQKKSKVNNTAFNSARPKPLKNSLNNSSQIMLECPHIAHQIYSTPKRANSVCVEDSKSKQTLALSKLKQTPQKAIKQQQPDPEPEFNVRPFEEVVQIIDCIKEMSEYMTKKRDYDVIYYDTLIKNTAFASFASDDMNSLIQALKIEALSNLKQIDTIQANSEASNHTPHLIFPQLRRFENNILINATSFNSIIDLLKFAEFVSEARKKLPVLFPKETEKFEQFCIRNILESENFVTNLCELAEKLIERNETEAIEKIQEHTLLEQKFIEQMKETWTMKEAEALVGWISQKRQPFDYGLL